MTPADEQERAQVEVLCDAVQQVTGETVKLAWADQGYTGENGQQAAQARGIDLPIVKLAEAKKGFVLLPGRWVVERSFGWLARFRRLTRDYEHPPSVLSGLHFLVFAIPKSHVLVYVIPWLCRDPLRGRLHQCTHSFPHLVR